MKNVMLNAWRLFTRDKMFISMLTVMPILIFLLMSALLPYTAKHSIAILNKPDDTAIEDSLNDIEGITIQDIDEDDIIKSVIGRNIDLAVVIDTDPATNMTYAQIIGTGDSEIQGAVELAVAKADGTSDSGTFTVNKVKKHKRSLDNTLAFMLFKFITGGNLLGTFIIMERNRRMKDRIMMSGISSWKYISGTALVYLIGTCIGSVVYYIAALLLDSDFGMRASWQYLVMVLLANVLAVAIYVFSASFTDSSETLETMTTMVLMPMGLFSGILFPFSYMPKVFRIIGSCCPQRWISHGVEQIQKTGSFTGALPDICLILGLSAVLYTIGVYRNGKRNAH